MKAYHNYILKLRQASQFGLILSVFILSLIAYAYFVTTPYFSVVENWAQSNYWTFVLFLLILKVIGIIWPPLPGVVPLIGAIPIIGWPAAFFIDLVGYIIGSIIAFFLARKFGLKVIRKLFGEAGVRSVERIRIKPQRQLEAITLMKIFGGGVGEFISYAAGITNIKFYNFFWGSILASVMVGIPLFYFFNFALSQNNLLYALLPLGVGALLFYILRKRYFDFK
ncbi:MAG TPA: VTT domain-containing protein [Candidatus Doudnabacteria bacterium]|nr:VTT domain-containing protein [Candidatus Doudnabacteria bacterium]